MWELAERAWSRSETHHDLAMEALRIPPARAALGESGAPPGSAGGGPARRGGSATALPGVAGPAGVAPTVPPQPTAPDANARETGARPVVNSWGLAGYTGPSRAAGAGLPVQVVPAVPAVHAVLAVLPVCAVPVVQAVRTVLAVLPVCTVLAVKAVHAVPVVRGRARRRPLPPQRRPASGVRRCSSPVPSPSSSPPVARTT
ncbi:hypothetical protein GCM10020295_31240 [Streptomyces cinereospinus]